MGFLVNLIPEPYRLLAAGIALAGSVLAIWAWGEHKESAGKFAGDKAGYARGHAEWVKLDSDMTAKALAAERRQRDEEQRRAKAQQEIEDAHQLALQKARADVAIADAAAGRLRERVIALVAASRSAAGHDTGAAPISPPADDAAGVFADVLGRCVARVRLLAAVADDRGAAGSACEQSYDALTAP